MKGFYGIKLGEKHSGSTYKAHQHPYVEYKLLAKNIAESMYNCTKKSSYAHQQIKPFPMLRNVCTFCTKNKTNNC